MARCGVCSLWFVVCGLMRAGLMVNGILCWEIIVEDRLVECKM